MPLTPKPKARRGLYRASLPAIGECARVTIAAGDAYPFLDRAMYEALGFWPDYEDLPPMPEADRARHARLFEGER